MNANKLSAMPSSVSERHLFMHSQVRHAVRDDSDRDSKETIDLDSVRPSIAMASSMEPKLTPYVIPPVLKKVCMPPECTVYVSKLMHMFVEVSFCPNAVIIRPREDVHA